MTTPAIVPEPSRLTAAVGSLRGVGPQLVARLEQLGIRRLQDLLFHLPLRYEDRTRLTPIGALLPGLRAQVEGELDVIERVLRRRPVLLGVLRDGTGQMRLRFFHYSRAQQDSLRRGVRLRCYGESRRGPQGLEMVHPDYRVLSATTPTPLAEHFTPVYPTVEGLSQARLRSLVEQVLAALLPEDDPTQGAALELLPPALCEALELPRLIDALRLVHRPPPELRLDAEGAGRHPGLQRLAFEELVAQQLALRHLKARREQDRAPALAQDAALIADFRARLPFKLTRAQERVVAEISEGLGRPVPMLRLLQGDVGAGKTIVACLAALQAIAAAGQVALMAPTELLAEQHQRNLAAWLAPWSLPVSLLTGKSKGRERLALLERLREGEPGIVIGTHALFQADIEFARLALVIIDEQHRFGVDQRLALRGKGRASALCPHQLIMTATPIPRTLAMTFYAGLSHSVIDELPPGRRPVTTVAVSKARRPEVTARVAEALRGGRQVYWVCTLIESSDELAAEAATVTAEALQQALPEVRIGLIHGRLSTGEKAQVMRAFANGDTRLLVATTVIEVGVDVPQASLMVIEDADRLGLAQLHQLRGRVGRGAVSSDCVLLYQAPLSRLARERLDVMRTTQDGFLIAERDLQLRGPGELLGRRQAGLAHLRIADLIRDVGLLPQVQAAADQLEARHPEHCAALIERWLSDQLRYALA